MTDKVYLKRNVMAEPLVNQWYAWSGLIAPATAAMYTANSHLKIMQSFVSAPQIHVAALKNPSMRGGPFINYEVSKVPDVRLLIEKLQREQSHLLELASAIKTLGELLPAAADGSSLEPLYQKVPDPLKGYVELIYDLNNSPSMRFIERLLYRSRYYDPSSQTVMLSRVSGDERSFALSTPNLGDAEKLQLPIPFASDKLDALFRMTTSPQPLEHIRDLLGVPESDAQMFATFFTEQSPPPSPRLTNDGVRIRYFGHACVLMETRETSVLTDPVVSYHHGQGIDRLTFDDLPEHLDYVLITHAHQDHCMFETLLQLRHKIGTIIVPKNSGGGLTDPSLKLILQAVGFERVMELDEMEVVDIEGGSITGLPFLGEHADLNIRSKIAYHVRLHGHSALFVADSNNIEPKLYDHLHAQIGDVDVLFIGMECEGGPLSWLYGPLLIKQLTRKQDQSRRLDGSDFEKALGIVGRLSPKHVYVYAMGQEPWLTFVTSIQYTAQSRPIVESNKLVEECRRRGLTAERLYGQKEINL